MIQVDRQALLDFADTMENLSTGIGDSRMSEALAYTGTDPGANPAEKWREGIRVTLGSVEHPHSGRVAGERMADHIAHTMQLVVSLEEGARAMGVIVRAIVNALSAEDEISAKELTDILNFVGISPLDRKSGA